MPKFNLSIIYIVIAFTFSSFICTIFPKGKKLFNSCFGLFYKELA